MVYQTQVIMLKYCLKCKKNTENINSKVIETNNVKRMLSWKFAVCNTKKSRFTNEQKLKGLLSSLGLKPPLKKIPLLVDILL